MSRVGECGFWPCPRQTHPARFTPPLYPALNCRRPSCCSMGGLAVEPVAAAEQLSSESFPQPRNSTRFDLQRSLREANMPVYDYVCKDCQKPFEPTLSLCEPDKGARRCSVRRHER